MTHYDLAGLLPRLDWNPVGFGQVGTGPWNHLAVPKILANIEFSSSYRITTSYVHRFYSIGCSFTSCIPIYDLNDIRWLAVKSGHIPSEIHGFSIVTQWILVRSQIWQQVVKERLKLHNVDTDHVMEQSELKYLIGAKIVNLKCRVFGRKTGQFPTVWYFCVVRPIVTVPFRVERNPFPTLIEGAFLYPSSITKGPKFPIQFRVQFQPGTRLLKWVLPHENPNNCDWASFTTKNPAFQPHNFRSN